ncbi:hypothetical protein Tco_0858062 [Tanacetum coccineum]|uniref:Uncharacterized protein n=1 Tax=Tanacetum coccineum TaxID=301880 RepID=A0ABQ5B892_9ASTR
MVDLTKDTLKTTTNPPADTNNAIFFPSQLLMLYQVLSTDLGLIRELSEPYQFVTNDMFQSFFKASSIEPISIMQRGYGKNSPQSIILSLEDKKNASTSILRKEEMPPFCVPSLEPVLRYLKFSAKGTKREVFGMPILNNLIIDDIRGESQTTLLNLRKVAKHQRYLAGEEVIDPDSPTPKPAKATKPKVAMQSKALAPKVAPITKPTSAKASMEPDFGKFQPLPEVQGKGKEKVKVEQVAQVLLNLQTLKKKSPADQYIFQRRTSTQTEPSGHDESSSLYAELGLTDSETDSDEEPNPEQMDEEFTKMAYPNVQENLKLPTEGEVRLEEPASSAGTLSSLQYLDKELSFADQFLVEKS